MNKKFITICKAKATPLEVITEINKKLKKHRLRFYNIKNKENNNFYFELEEKEKPTKKTYYITTHCINCDILKDYTIPYGEKAEKAIKEKKCKYCGCYKTLEQK